MPLIFKNLILRLRPWSINWQDRKYTSFAIFICHSQNIQRHSATSCGRRRKHWIES